jgi:hypothetical protein
MRVWETPVEELLTRGLGLLPLAVLGRMPRGQSRKEALPGVLERIASRAVREAPPDHLRQVVIAAMILSGMYLDREAIARIVRRFPAVIESSAYEVFEELGAIITLRKTVLMLGREKFGEPTEEQARKLEGIDDLPRLNRLAVRVLQVNDWDSLLRGR